MWPLVTRLFFVDCLTKRLSFCYHTVNKDQRYQDSSQPQWQRLSHPACSLHMERGISSTTSRIFLYEYHRNSGLQASWCPTNATFIVACWFFDEIGRARGADLNSISDDVITLLRGRQLYRSLLQPKSQITSGSKRQNHNDGRRFSTNQPNCMISTLIERAHSQLHVWHNNNLQLPF